MDTVLDFIDAVTRNFTRFVDFSMGVMFGIGIYLFAEKVNIVRAIAAHFAGGE